MSERYTQCIKYSVFIVAYLFSEYYLLNNFLVSKYSHKHTVSLWLVNRLWKLCDGIILSVTAGQIFNCVSFWSLYGILQKNYV